MNDAVFHLVAFAGLALGFFISALLFSGVAIVLQTASVRSRRCARRACAKHVLANTPRFDLAIDG